MTKLGTYKSILIMGVTQLVGFAGPTIADILIGRYSASSFGIGLAFVIDTVSFTVSATCLWLIHTGSKTQPSEKESI